MIPHPPERKVLAFPVFLTASALLRVADGIALVSIPWFTTLLTSDAALIALVLGITRVPWLILAVPVGVWIDRHPRRMLLLGSIGMSVIILLILALQASMIPDNDGPATAVSASLLGFFTLIFLGGATQVMRETVEQTVLPDIVSSAQLERANGRLHAAYLICGSILAPPVAGYLFSIDYALPFSAQALLLTCAALLLWRIPISRPFRAPTDNNFWADLIAGLRLVAANALLGRLALILAVLNAATGLAFALLVPFVRETLVLDAWTYGLVLMIAATGALPAGFCGHWFVRVLSARRTFMFSLCCFPIALGLLATAGDLPTIIIALFIETFASVLLNMLTISWRQRLVTPAMLGRVNGAYRMIVWGGLPIGSFLAAGLIAMLAPSFGTEWALRLSLAASALVCIFVSGAAFILMRRHMP
ncbi:MFS transporter [Cognatiyoonia sp. IB215446]|uniref:MFS transporter n=1 Tax=Cognatiyoonia sp. IB215446 TaxID=3097355 RepID=UPI002A0B078C|nr:MFS transporter [Cognatiyoonia sp. IB215446]MDX8348117.1 MFS transporter [Cognatiyoonia sp. IB215446]